MTAPDVDDFRSALREFWHDRPPASLEDVLTLYGVMATAAEGGELFRTPGALEDFVDEGRLVTIHVDLTGASPSYETTTLDHLREDDVPTLGYSAKSSGRGADYSVTQSGSKSGNDPEAVADTILKRVRLWCHYDSVLGVTGPEDGHPDGWVVESLGAIFEKDSDSLARAKADVESLLTGSEPTVVTISVTVDTADLDQGADSGVQTLSPGELDVLEAAMRRYSGANNADKNLDGRTSEGQATGFVTGEAGRVVGTPESPLETFSIKHPDVQPGLRRTASWRNYPIDEVTAQLIAKGSELVELCVLREGSVETYALPYFAGDLTPEKAKYLYDAIQSLDPDAEHDGPPLSAVTYYLDEHEDESIRALTEELRFHYLTLPISDDTHVIAETSTATTYWVNEVADAYVETVTGPTGTARTGGFGSSPNWPLLNPPADRDQARWWAFNRIVGRDRKDGTSGHNFVDATFARRTETEDDFRRVATQRLIEGRALPASVLFEEYVTRLGDAFDGDVPPWQIAAIQFLQFEALDRVGLVAEYDATVAPNQTTMSDELTSTDLDTIREHRLETFLDRPLFTPDEDSPAERQSATERRAAFLSGVFVGQLSWYQENERSIGRPLDARTQADKLTPRVLEQTVQAALDDARIYAGESDYDSNVLYPEVVDRLLDAMETQPTDWTLEKRELQFLVALGQSYGRRAMPVAFDVQAENEAADPNQSTTEQEA